MLFVCSKLGFSIFTYGGGEGVDFGALSKLVVTVGALTARGIEFFQISVGNEHYTAKPFMVSEHCFYCVATSNSKYSTLVAHLLGNAIKLVFWEEFSILLRYLDRKSAAEMNSSTIMDTLGKGCSNIDDIISEVFVEESVRDNFLMFEEHFMRGLDMPPVGSVFDHWFAPMLSLQREVFSVEFKDKTNLIANGAADLFVLELPSTIDASVEPLIQLYAERLVQHVGFSTQKVAANRRPLALCTRSMRVVTQCATELASIPNENDAKVATKLMTTPDMVALLLSVISGNILLVLQFALSDEISSGAMPAVSDVCQDTECLSQELRCAWRQCCENIATALPRPTQAPRHFDLTPHTFEKLLHIS